MPRYLFCGGSKHGQVIDCAESFDRIEMPVEKDGKFRPIDAPNFAIETYVKRDLAFGDNIITVQVPYSKDGAENEHELLNLAARAISHALAIPIKNFKVVVSR